MLNKLTEDIKTIKTPIIILTIYFIITQTIFGYVCPSKILFNLDCPGCGLTRACFYMLTFQFEKSMELNPSAIFWIILILLFLTHRYIKPLHKNLLLIFSIFTCLITFIVYFVNI